MKDSAKIAVIGGGAAGVEMAAEIADLYPQKMVSYSLVGNARSKILTNNMSIKSSTKPLRYKKNNYGRCCVCRLHFYTEGLGYSTTGELLNNSERML